MPKSSLKKNSSKFSWQYSGWLYLLAGILVSAVLIHMDWLKDSLAVFAPIAISLAIWRSFTADKQTKLAESSLLQNRYQSAANMLGSDSMATRIGGIDALKEIAETEHDYHTKIMESLSALIRHPKEKPEIRQDYDSIDTDTLDMSYFPKDFLMALNAIIYRSEGQKKMEPEDWHIDLTGALLFGLDCTGADFTRIKLNDVNLTKTNLTDVKGIKQSDLDKACHYFKIEILQIINHPPILTGAMCAESKKKKQLTPENMTQISYEEESSSA